MDKQPKSDESKSEGKNQVNFAPRSQLVDAATLLIMLFAPECRPSLRWLRTLQSRRVLPHRRLGRLVFFDPEECRQVLQEKYAVGHTK